MSVSVKFSPFGNSQISDAAGNPASGWTIGTYVAGSSTRLAAYTDATGNTAQSADIRLDANGRPETGQIWLAAGSTYKFIVKNASGVTQFTVDNIAGVNDTGAATVSQWQASGLTPTFISTTSFTAAGDQTTEFHVRRKLQFITSAGTVYGEILTTAFGTLTTVTMAMDSGQALDAGLSVVNLSLLRADHLALPGVAASVRDVGEVGYFARSTAPTGWLKANGAAVSRTTYADLFAVISTTYGVGDGSTTFNVPDLRGEFIRALDDSRGVDVARVLGSAQSGDNAPHTHTGTTSSDGAHTHTYTAQNAVGIPSRNASGTDSISPQTLNTSSDGAHTHTMTTASSGTEARPRNIALLACIKY